MLTDSSNPCGFHRLRPRTATGSISNGWRHAAERFTAKISARASAGPLLAAKIMSPKNRREPLGSSGAPSSAPPHHGTPAPRRRHVHRAPPRGRAIGPGTRDGLVSRKHGGRASPTSNALSAPGGARGWHATKRNAPAEPQLSRPRGRPGGRLRRLPMRGRAMGPRGAAVSLRAATSGAAAGLLKRVR